jgi:hypothetical protein
MGKSVGLCLANNTKLGIRALDESTLKILLHLEKIMQLEPIAEADFQVSLMSEGLETTLNKSYSPLLNKDGNKFRCISIESCFWTVYSSGLDEVNEIVISFSRRLIGMDFWVQLFCISSILGLISMDQGGMLIHGALASRNGEGIIFAGRSGAGKTTATNRLPMPWRSICDDMIMIIPDVYGKFWAHPLPTHSRFKSGSGGVWDAQDALPLKNIFFLNQDRNDRVQQLDKADAIRLLVDSSMQNIFLLVKGANREATRKMNTILFNNAYSLSCAVPTYRLNLSLNGRFWEEIERLYINEI